MKRKLFTLDVMLCSLDVLQIFTEFVSKSRFDY